MSKKYEIKGTGGCYSVPYGEGYPYSEFIRYTVFTMWGAKRVIRRHKRRLAKGKVQPGNRYEIAYTEEALTPQDVKTRIKQLERELGIQ